MDQKSAITVEDDCPRMISEDERTAALGIAEAQTAPDSHARHLRLNTASGSILHRVAGYDKHGALRSPVSPLRVYLWAVGFTCFPLLLLALLDFFSVAQADDLTRLPFFVDWNVIFMFVVSFPCIAILVLTDQSVLTEAVEHVQQEQTVEISETHTIALASRWHRRFRNINLGAQVAGIAIGLLVAYLNYLAYSPREVGHWMSRDGALLPVGYFFLFSIFLFYFLASIYVLRCVAFALLLKDVVSHAELRLLPSHPDKAGGLRKVGNLGLRNQYALTLLGLNVVLLIVVSMRYLDVPPYLYELIVAAVIGYLVLGPLVFVGPLLPFRSGMLKTKSALMSEVAKRLRIELQRLRGELQSGTITKEDEELIERLRKFGAVIDELPVWPFDSGTVQKFLVAYVIPIVSSVSYPALKALVGLMAT